MLDNLALEDPTQVQLLSVESAAGGRKAYPLARALTAHDDAGQDEATTLEISNSENLIPKKRYATI